MEVSTATREDEPSAGSGAAGLASVEVFRSPIENPAIDRIPNDPLVEPHPGEPGVGADGSAAPLENPDDRLSADPLLHGA